MSVEQISRMFQAEMLSNFIPSTLLVVLVVIFIQFNFVLFHFIFKIIRNFTPR